MIGKGKLTPLNLPDDRLPVTQAEIERTHDRLRSHMRGNASTFRDNFRRYDKDRSGCIDRDEAAQMIMGLRLRGVREKCLQEIFKLADTDGSGDLNYTEFCTLSKGPRGRRPKFWRGLARAHPAPRPSSLPLLNRRPVRLAACSVPRAQ